MGVYGFSSWRMACVVGVPQTASDTTISAIWVEAVWTRRLLLEVVVASCSLVSSPSTAVSYTHLRAHETPEHLVCRLLLEKKKKNKNVTMSILSGPSLEYLI
eukprot:TRINITY_DN45081_c0_g1_i1.p1 TRINITY_DN45081_c0_g1~~TRINITY_DN45081_c0_g1_i1.p1  ORF type:complete len:102 (+),score=15.21 TRINITY_DN45081_c0_g1_i1:337-642(+)